jgi:transposase
VAHLAKRWDEGCRNAQQLWREISQQGFKGSHRMVTWWAQARRDATVPIAGRATPVGTRHTRKVVKAGTVTLSYEKPLTSSSQTSQTTKTPIGLPCLPANRELAWVILDKTSEAAEKADQQDILNVLNGNHDFKCATTLVQRFADLVRNGQPQQLNRWIHEAVTSGIEELASFATGLQRDFDTVRAAVATHWSNAQSEGQITRLKLNKRLMYGRAKLDLLRIRCLHPV